MKLRNNQSGVAHLAAILVVVVVIAIGAVGWKVWDNSNAKEQNNSPSQSDSQKNKKDIDAQANDAEEKKASLYSTHTHTTDGYSFQYPKDWKVEQSSQGPSTLVTSPDFKNEDNSGRTGNSSGGRFILSKSAIVDGTPTLEDILNNKSGVDIDGKKLTVSGRQAVQFKRTDPAVSIKTTIFTSEFTYELSYFGPNSSDYQKYLVDYDNIVSTFKIN